MKIIKEEIQIPELNVQSSLTNVSKNKILRFSRNFAS